MSEFFPANKCFFAHGCQVLPVAVFDATFGFKSSLLNVVSDVLMCSCLWFVQWPHFWGKYPGLPFGFTCFECRSSRTFHQPMFVAKFHWIISN